MSSEPVTDLSHLDEGQPYRVLGHPKDGQPFDFDDEYNYRDGNTLVFRCHRINLDVMTSVEITARR